MLLPTTLCILVIVGYAATFVLYFVNFELRSESLTSWAQRAVLLTLVTHAGSIVYLMLNTGGLGGSSLAHHVIPLLIVALCYYMEIRWGGRNLLLFALPITILFCLLAVFSASGPLPQQSGASPWFLLHAGFIFCGFAGFLAAVSSALMYLAQSAQLKSKHLGRVFVRLPSLGTLDRIHSRSLLIGVVLFSIGILCGLFWAGRLNGREFLLRDPKVILSFFTCGLYCLILVLRLSNVRRGHKIALGTVIAFAALIATFVSAHTTPALLQG